MTNERRMPPNMGCIICGQGCGFFDKDGNEPCYGCNFITCECGAIIPYDTKCYKCGKVTYYKKRNSKDESNG